MRPPTSAFLSIVLLFIAGCAEDTQARHSFASPGRTGTAAKLPSAQVAADTPNSVLPRETKGPSNLSATEAPPSSLPAAKIANVVLDVVPPTQAHRVDSIPASAKSAPKAVQVERPNFQPSTEVAPPQVTRDVATTGSDSQTHSSAAVPTISKPEVGLLIAVAVCVIILVVRYQISETGRVRRRARQIVRDIQTTSQELTKFTEEVNASATTAAAGYIAAVRKQYLQSVSIEEVRKLAPGARIQPLRDRGLATLLDCQGWDAAKFHQLRGIGPDSATRIAAACAALTKSAYSQPIVHPSQSDSSTPAQKLYHQLFVVLRIREKLMGPYAALESVLKHVQAKSLAVHTSSSFFHWMLGSESKGALQLAIENGHALAAEMEPAGQNVQVLANAKSQLEDAKITSTKTLVDQDVTKDVAANEVFYRDTLTRLLGPNMPAGTRVSPPVIPQLFGSPALQPVRVQMPGASTSGYSITRRSKFDLEIQLGRSRPARVGSGSPKSPAECWIPPGQEASIAGYRIPGGLIYVGENLLSANARDIEPALIDPAQPIASDRANCHERMLNYWSNYSYADPAARASYLQWLAGGKKDPLADVGYVFLYFYGLERRALADALQDPVARAEIPQITEEVRRLQSLYADNHSLKRYTETFIEYLSATQSMASASKDTDVPPPGERYALSFELRLRLGRFAVDGHPLPAKWAYAWYYSDPRTRLPAAAERCPEQALALFEIEYQRRFGSGLILPANKTRLKLTYRPASASFGGLLTTSSELPDVSVLSASYTKIDAIATDCYQQLDSYSRFIRRAPDQAKSFDALVVLPSALWPETTKQTFGVLAEKISSGGTAHTLTLRELAGMFHQTSPFSRGKYLALCRALGGLGIGIEPDPRFSNDVPNLEDSVALFATDIAEKLSPSFGLASLSMQLASAIAFVDGKAADVEVQRLRQEIESDSSLQLLERKRLMARIETYRIKPPTITGLRPMIERMNAETKTKVADFLLAIVLADGVIDPSEVKMMEKIYGLFGMDAADLYSRLHELGSVPLGSAPSSVRLTSVSTIDMAKVRRLRAVSEDVTKKLTVIFAADDKAEAAHENEAVAAAKTDTVLPPTLLDLDVPHADLLTILLGRAQWTRAEFEEVCTDKGLMPDGAIERINDAAFTKFNQAIVEGEDPLEIGVELVNQSAA